MMRILKVICGIFWALFCCPDDCCDGAVEGFKGDLRYVVRDPAWQPWADIIPECKCQEKLNIWKAIEQAISSAGRHKWMLLFKRNRTETFVVMSLVDLMNLFVETVEDLKGE